MHVVLDVGFHSCTLFKNSNIPLSNRTWTRAIIPFWTETFSQRIIINHHNLFDHDFSLFLIPISLLLLCIPSHCKLMISQRQFCTYFKHHHMFRYVKCKLKIFQHIIKAKCYHGQMHKNNVWHKIIISINVLRNSLHPS